LARLYGFPAVLGIIGAVGHHVAKDVRMATNKLFSDGENYIADIEMAKLLGHLRVIDRLEKQVAQFLTQVSKILSLDGVGDLVSFFDSVVTDGTEILLQVPGTTAIRIAERRHDFDQTGNITGRLHGTAHRDAESLTSP